MPDRDIRTELATTTFLPPCLCGNQLCAFWRDYLQAVRTEEQLWKQADRASENRRDASRAHTAHLTQTAKEAA
jgi:hypothetical protein